MLVEIIDGAEHMRNLLDGDGPGDAKADVSYL